MDEFTGFQTGNLCKHHQQCAVLYYVPVICCQCVLRTLVQDTIQFVACYVECHAVRTRFQTHFCQVCKVVDICHDTSGCRCIFQLPQNIIYLVHFTVGEFIFHAQLVAVSFTNCTFFISPLIPDAAVQFFCSVGFFLPDPQDLVDTGFPECLTQCHHGEFFLQVVSVHHTESFYCVGRCAVFPFCTYNFVFCGETMLQDLSAVFFENDIRFTQNDYLLLSSSLSSSEPFRVYSFN